MTAQAENYATRRSSKVAERCTGGHEGNVTPLFSRLLECAGLPRVVANASLTRALARSGVDAEHMGASELRRALASIRTTLLVYHAEAEAARRFQLIEALCEDES